MFGAAPAGDHPKQCYPCGANVAQCDQLQATSCAADYSPLSGRRSVVDPKNCYYNKCGPRMRPVGFTTECTSCPNGASTCSYNGDAQICDLGLFLDQTVIPFVCTATCPAGYRKQYNDPISGDYCGRCPNYNAGVLTCSSRGDHLTCADGYLLQNLYYDQCVLPCPEGQWRESGGDCGPCRVRASKCDVNGTPLECPPPLNLEETPLGLLCMDPR
ncbi:hypothetical protein JCM6882_006636 [Rhodosporidiobolus microsporus]